MQIFRSTTIAFLLLASVLCQAENKPFPFKLRKQKKPFQATIEEVFNHHILLNFITEFNAKKATTAQKKGLFLIKKFDKATRQYISNWVRPNYSSREDFRRYWQNLPRISSLVTKLHSQKPPLSATHNPQKKLSTSHKKTTPTNKNTTHYSKQYYTYGSKNFIFYCDGKLSSPTVKFFERLFEGTKKYLSLFPFGNVISLIEGKKSPVFLHTTREIYTAHGGTLGSGGFYSQSKNEIHIPLTSLGLYNRRGIFHIKNKKQNTILVHEAVHMFTDYPFYSLPFNGWYTEGIAEYIAYSKYRGGTFTNTSPSVRLRHYRGNSYTLPNGSLKHFMLQPYSQFIENSQNSYPLAYFLIIFYLHYFGKKGEHLVKALRLQTQKAPLERVFQALFNSQPEAEIKKKFTKFLKRYRIKLN